MEIILKRIEHGLNEISRNFDDDTIFTSKN